MTYPLTTAHPARSPVPVDPTDYGLIVCDGTWNDALDRGLYGTKDWDTSTGPPQGNHPAMLYQLWAGGPRDYKSGAGTRHSWVGRLIGGAFGVGAKKRAHEALRFMRANPGVRWVLVGYSRGAAAVFYLALLVEEYNRGRQRHEQIHVEGLVLFDLVASYGYSGVLKVLIPNRWRRRWNVEYEAKLPTVSWETGERPWCLHILALDEPRPAFRPTRVLGADEFWMAGAHHDIGGTVETRDVAKSSIVAGVVGEYLTQKGVPWAKRVPGYWQPKKVVGVHARPLRRHARAGDVALVYDRGRGAPI